MYVKSLLYPFILMKCTLSVDIPEEVKLIDISMHLQVIKFILKDKMQKREEETSCFELHQALL